MARNAWDDADVLGAAMGARVRHALFITWQERLASSRIKGPRARPARTGLGLNWPPSAAKARRA